MSHTKRASWLVCFTTFMTFGLAGSAVQAGSYPILFVPEYCSAAGSWNSMFQNLPKRRFGDELVRLSQAADGSITAIGSDRPATAMSFAIEFRGPPGAAAADVSLRQKAAELKSAVDQIKALTGQSRIIIVGHGMGGLVGRTYIQGLATTPDGDSIGYAADVAGLITIGTPHLGFDPARVAGDGEPACGAIESLGSFLEIVNRAGWPIGTRLDAMSSYYADPPNADTDGVVTRTGQDVRAVSEYWATHPDVRVWSQPLSGRSLAGLPGVVAHSAVIRTNVTAALVNSIVEEIDAAAAPVSAAPMATEGLPESPHPYANSINTSFSYTLAGNPGAIDVTFDPQTYAEWDYDFIHVTDGAGAAVTGSPFTGNQLGGRTLRIQGSTVGIRLVSDSTITEYGFRLISVNAATSSAQLGTLPESPHPYADNYYGIYRYTLAGEPAAIDVRFDSLTSVEDEYDYIFVTDGAGTQVGGSPFTGSGLAGRTLRIQGATVRVELQTDGSVGDYGFRVAGVTAASGAATGGATISVSGTTASYVATATGVTYQTVLTVRETGSRCAATIQSIRLNLTNVSRNGSATFDASSNITTALAAGGSNTYRLNVTSTNATDPYTSVRFVVTFSDVCSGVQNTFSTPAGTGISPPSAGTTPTAGDFVGSWSGTYSGDATGTIELSIANNAITVTRPNRGDGTINLGSLEAAGSFFTRGDLGECTWTGPFLPGGARQSSASGLWSCTNAGAPVRRGNWSVLRRATAAPPTPAPPPATPPPSAPSPSGGMTYVGGVFNCTYNAGGVVSSCANSNITVNIGVRIPAGSSLRLAAGVGIRSTVAVSPTDPPGVMTFTGFSGGGWFDPSCGPTQTTLNLMNATGVVIATVTGLSIPITCR